MSTKGCWGLFFCLDLKLLKNVKKRLCKTSSFQFLSSLVNKRRVQSFSKKYSTLSLLELVKVLNFSDKILGFSETIEICTYFCMRFCITYLVLSNYNKITPKTLNNGIFDIIYLEDLDNCTCAASSLPIV